MRGIESNKVMKAGFVMVPVVIVAIGLLLFSVLPKSNTVNMEGSVEISTSPYFSKVTGTVTEVRAEAGESIKAGDILAVIDSGSVGNEIEQLQSTLIIKNAALKELNKDPQVSAIDAARKSAQENVSVCMEQLAAAQRSLKNAQADLDAQTRLFQTGALSERELKNYKIAAEEGASAVSIAKAQLAAAENTVNTIEYPEKNLNDIRAAQADVHLTELQIEKLESSRDDYVMKAIHDGVVVSRNVGIGSHAVLGQSLFELSNDDDKYFVFYLPEENAQAVAFGDNLDLYQLNSDKKIGTANICYIDWKAIYTPKDFETSANKSKRSIKIKALIDSEERLNVGETIVTRIEK